MIKAYSFIFYMNFIRKAKIMFYVHVGHVLRVNIKTGNDTIFAQYFIPVCHQQCHHDLKSFFFKEEKKSMVMCLNFGHFALASVFTNTYSI